MFVKKRNNAMLIIVVAVTLLISLATAALTAFSAETEGGKGNGTLVVSYNGANEAQGQYTFDIGIKTLDGAPINAPSLLITAGGNGAQFVKLDPASITYLQGKGYSVSGTHLGTGYTLTPSTGFSEITIEDLKFFSASPVINAQVKDFTFTLCNGPGGGSGGSSNEVDSYVFEKTITLPRRTTYTPEYARVNPGKKIVKHTESTISYKVHFELGDNVNNRQLDTTLYPNGYKEGEYEALGQYQPARTFQMRIQIPGSLTPNASMSNGVNNFFGNLSLADFGTPDFAFSNVEGCTINVVDDAFFKQEGNEVYIYIRGTMNVVDATQYARFDCTVTFAAQQLRGGAVPAAVYWLYRDRINLDNLDSPTLSPATSEFEETNPQNRDFSTGFAIKDSNDHATADNFMKEAEANYWQSVVADELLGNGALLSFRIKGKDGVLGNSNDKPLCNMYFVDELENSTTGNLYIADGSDPGNLVPDPMAPPAVWLKGGYDPFYFGRDGIQYIESGRFVQFTDPADPTKEVAVPVSVYAKVWDKTNNQWVIPADTTSHPQFIPYGDGNYYRVGAEIYAHNQGYYYAQILAAFGIPDADRTTDKYVVHGALWSLEGVVDPTMVHRNYPRIQLKARVEDPTNPATHAKIEADYQNNPQEYIRNKAKITYQQIGDGFPAIQYPLYEHAACKTGTTDFRPDDYLRIYLHKFQANWNDGRVLSLNWVQDNGHEDKRGVDRINWMLRLHNSTDSKANYRSTDGSNDSSEGEIIIRDAFNARTTAPGKQFSVYVLTEAFFDRYPAASWNNYPDYASNWADPATGAIRVPDTLFEVVDEPAGSDPNYSVQTYRIKLNEATGALKDDLEPYYSFEPGKKGLRPGSMLVVLYNTSMLEQKTLPTGSFRNHAMTVAADPFDGYGLSTVGENDMYGGMVTGDLNGNGKVDRCLTTSAFYQINARDSETQITALFVDKYVKKAGDADFVKEKRDVAAGDIITYKLDVRAGSGEPLSNIIIEDLLPFVGDTKILGSASRGSDWQALVTVSDLLDNLNVRLDGTPVAVTDVLTATTQWRIEISTHDGSDEVKSFKILPPDGFMLDANKGISLTFDASVPNVPAAHVTGNAAVNSFAVTATSGGKSHAMESLATAVSKREAIKVEYEFVTTPAGAVTPPSDVTTPTADLDLVKGTVYTAQTQTLSADTDLVFKGWFVDEACTTPYVTTALYSDTILYGYWLKKAQAQSPTKVVVGETGAAGADVFVGDELTYQITYYNHEVDPLDFRIIDVLPAGVDFISATGSAHYDSATHTVTWDLSAVPAGSGGSVVVMVAVNSNPDAENTLRNKATVIRGVGTDSEETEDTPETSNDVYVKVKYVWYGDIQPADVTPPLGGQCLLIRKGSAYTALKQTPSQMLVNKYKLVFAGWFTDNSTRTKYQDGTKLSQSETILYGCWEQGEKVEDMTPPDDTPDDNETPLTPKTGEYPLVALYLMLVLTAVIALATVRSKREKNV